MFLSDFRIESDVRCELGEGLYVESSLVAWVDINSNTLFCLFENGDLLDVVLPVTPSVILDRSGNNLLIGCDRGLCSVGLFTQEFEVVAEFPKDHDISTHRSNDGCRISSNKYIISTMERNNPRRSSGRLYLFEIGKKPVKLNCEIGIPNGFVVLSELTMLVCDSLVGEIYETTIDVGGLRCEMTQWYSSGAQSGVPDGGCLLPDNTLLFAVWGGAVLKQFDRLGHLIRNIKMPVIQPTNCKYDATRSRLFISSACEGSAIKNDDRQLSGHTFSYDVNLAG